MAEETAETPKPNRLKHIRIEGFRSDEAYGRPQRDMSGMSSGRNRDVHGPKLEGELAAAFARAHELLMTRDPAIQAGTAGVYLEVASAEGGKLPNLNWPSQEIRLGAARVTEAGAEVGTLFVPASAEAFLTEKVRQYARESTPKQEPKHQDRFEPLETIRAATIESLWTDQRPFPIDPDERMWWECWCWSDRAGNLVQAARKLGVRASDRRLHFPEFEVIPVYGTRGDLTRLLQNTDAIEELRRATDTPVFFTTTVRREQGLWVADLGDRIAPPGPDSPAVCILDNGVARAHPLLSIALDEGDCLAVDQDWGVDDHEPGGHGTNMAGCVLFADLTYPLSDGSILPLDVRLESVKFLPPPGFQPTDPQNYGAITQAAVALPEINNAGRSRVFCMAVTNGDVSGERPTSWSAALDQICAGTMPGDAPGVSGEAPRRLFVVSAGNVPDAADPDDVSDPDEFPIEDPAQAWNAVAVGGFTDKVDVTDLGMDTWKAVAEVGDLSPYSRISTDWDHSRTAIKPEIVFEAGNRALSASGRELLAGLDSLSLLTTGKDFLTEPLTTFWATSPATAQAAGMAGAIMARHPDLWPEAIRALMVHSAEWTPAMRARLRACRGRKRECIALARQFGYGVPRLDRALASAQNDVALVAQAHIQPFKRERKADKDGRMVLCDPTFNEVHYYQLPWPRKTLEDLGEKDVRLKITLSYFIEPSPGDIAPVTSARYQSFGLRFELKRPTETEAVFRQRINRLERVDEQLPTADPDTRWTFGSQSVAAGSLHCDVWVGPAAELAARGLIAIHPVSGWWRYRTQLKRYNSVARYALVVSITAEEMDVELYTEIANLIGIETEIVT
ncbi:MAG TPA: S8 family peptidase [Azospirillum sp.]